MKNRNKELLDGRVRLPSLLTHSSVFSIDKLASQGPTLFMLCLNRVLSRKACTTFYILDEEFQKKIIIIYRMVERPREKEAP